MDISQIINQNSYSVAAFILIALIAAIPFARARRKWIAIGGVIALLIAAIAFNFIFRVDGEIHSRAQFDEIRATQQPIVLEMYSNY